MRKQSIIPLAILLLTLTACQSPAPPPAAPSTASPPPASQAAALPAPATQAQGGQIADYFKADPNTLYSYVSSPVDYASQVAYVTFTSGSRIQRYVATSTVESTEVLEISNGQLVLVYNEPQFYYLENITDVKPTLHTVILQEPLQVGQTWAMDSSGSCTITDMNAPVDTPSGSYTAMEITTAYADGINEKAYYAKGVGLVQTVYTTADGTQVNVSLDSVTPDSGVKKRLILFSPNTDTNSLDQSEQYLGLRTNGDVSAELADLLTAAADAPHFPLLFDRSDIKDVELDRAANQLTLNFSSGFAAAVKAEADGELLLRLQGLADTLGSLYGVATVSFQVEGGTPAFGGLLQNGGLTVEQKDMSAS